MNLNFFHPGLLYGLFACAIPIIIHLLFKRRFQRVQWAAMKFLLAAYKKTKTSLLLENILLLILRILIIVVLVLLFARPIARVAPQFAPSRPSENFLIVLDNSYSMGVRSGNVSPFDNAKQQAKAIIENARKNDKISVITMNERPREVITFATIVGDAKRSEIVQRMEEIALSHMATDVETSILLLKQLIDNKEYDNKHAYIITDCQQQPWLDAINKGVFIEALGEICKQTLSLTLVDVAIPQPQNIGVVELECDGLAVVGSQSRFVATLKNYGDKHYENAALHLYVDGQKQKTEQLQFPLIRN